MTRSVAARPVHSIKANRREFVLGSLAAAIGVPTAMAIQMWREGQWDFVLLGFGIVVMILAFVRHRTNIQRLIAGTESKAFTKKKPQP